MVSLNSIGPSRIFSALTDKARHPLTILFGVVVIGAIGRYVYRRLYPSLLEKGRQALEKKDYEAFERLREEASEKKDSQTLHGLGRLALEKGEYRRAAFCFDSELNATPSDYMIPYYWRNVADLKIGDFYRAKDGSDNAFKGKNLDKRIEAQLHLQKAQANMGLHQLETVRASIDEAIRLYPASSKSSFQTFMGWLPIFREDAKYFPSQSRFIAQAEYLKAVLSFMEGNLEGVVQACNQALTQLSDQDLAFKMEILSLKALAYCERENYEQSLEVATATLQLNKLNNASKETLVTLHFCRAVSYPKYEYAYHSFDEALLNSHDDPLLCGYILFQQGCFYKAFAKAPKESSTGRNSLLSMAHAAFDQADSKCISGKQEPLRCDPLVRCILWSLLKDSQDKKSPTARLQAKIKQERTSSVQAGSLGIELVRGPQIAEMFFS
ncbi:MAG: hypothetical protein JSS10_00230 [Verrucomicrobia bacterium]|nr:hypothetical protein [Verrucomicrobiota bacterium]